MPLVAALAAHGTRRSHKFKFLFRLLTSDRYAHLDQYAEETLEATMDLPPRTSYRDLTANSPLPDFAQENIDIFLDR